MPRLSDLLKSLAPGYRVNGPTDLELSAITADSRRVTDGALFVAIKGTGVDGHDFINAAVKAGARAVVGSHMPDGLPDTVTTVIVDDPATALGRLASRWYGDPSRSLRLVGVTGTNGKTTVATLIYEISRLYGLRAGLLSTVVNIVDTERVAATHTTPDPIELNSLLRRMVDAGCEIASMEVSSHAADQHRIAGLHFAGGIFTNLTRDHLDYHKTFDAYLRAKQSFFDMLPAEAFALTNADDRNGAVMVQNTRARVFDYSVRADADFRGRIIENRLDGMLISFNGTEVETLFTGRFNASNLTAVYGAATLLGFDPERLPQAMSALVPVAGRFQTFRSPSGVTAIVDYAHTPDALINVLDTIRDIVGRGHASVITVCGCGGDRDRGKRPMMAAAAASRSDRLILTSDNPRSEDPVAIIDDMLAGLDDEARRTTLSITDRREAIRTATALARPGDVILVAGKGHEDYQIIGSERHHFDDREEVRAALGII